MRSNQACSSSALPPEPVRRALDIPASISAGGDRREVQLFGAVFKPADDFGRHGPLAGCEDAQHVILSQIGLAERRGVALGLDGIRDPISRAAKLGRSVGYSRFASSTGTTTAAGLPCLVMVVASPRSAASTIADKEALASRRPSILMIAFIVTTCSHTAPRDD